jgi:hypothetical protein
MLITKLVEFVGPRAQTKCDGCRDAVARLQMDGYAEEHARNRLCTDCSLQLARKLLEDLCELLTRGGRHG